MKTRKCEHCSQLLFLRRWGDILWYAHRTKRYKLACEEIRKHRANSALVVELRRINPCMTLEDIGAQFGVTRARISQILHENGVETRAVTLHQMFECQQCGAAFPKKRNSCTNLFCSLACSKAANRLVVPCGYCSKPVPTTFGRYSGTQRNGKARTALFCGMPCRAQWQKAFKIGRPATHDHQAILSLLADGLRASQVSRQLQVPYSVVWNVKRRAQRTA